MRFEEDPFVLDPVREDQIDLLFIDRKEEIEEIKVLLTPDFEKKKVVTPIIGGIGTGKSSLLIHVKAIAKEFELNTILLKNYKEFMGKEKKEIREKDVVLIDNIDKLNNEKAYDFYTDLESLFESGGIVFFSDTYQRDKETANLREFSTSDLITLPQSLNKKELGMFLKRRMEKTVLDEDFTFPFEDKTIELASIRSLGNLRKFFKYTNKAWTIFRTKDKDNVEKKDMMRAIMKVDRAEIGRLDPTSLDILWNCTVARKNKGVLSMDTNTHRSTVTNRLNNELETLTKQVKEGKEVKVSSIYRELPDGIKILKQIFEDLGHRDMVN